jgi:WD40 repeat protein
MSRVPLFAVRGLPRPAGPVNPAQTRMVQELRHDSPLLSCRFDPSGRFVFAGAQDSTVQRWELAGGRKTSLTGNRSWVRGMTFMPGPRKLITAAYDGRLTWWQLDAAAPEPEHVISAHRGWARAVAVSPDGRLVASCGNDHLVRLWSASDGSPVRDLEGHTCHVYNVAFHPDGRHLVSGDLRGVVKQWDHTRGTVVRTFDASVLHRYDTTFRADIGGVRSMAFSADGGLLACSGITDVTNAFAGIGKPVVVLFDWNTGARRHLLRPQANFQGTAWGVGFHSSGFIAGAGGGSGGALWFWRPDQPASFFTLALPNNARDLHLHPDGRRLAIAFFDGAVRIYEMSA